MIREEAIKALERAENYAGIQCVNSCVDAYISPYLLKAIDFAISALREQEEREDLKPLTLDELHGMNGEPVWLLPDKKCFIVNNNFLLPHGERHPCGVDMWGAGTSLSLLAKCGVYRCLPKEE